MIDNSDKIGNWFVTIICHRNAIASFQCPTLEDAKQEAEHIGLCRQKEGLPTDSAYCKQLVGKTSRKRNSTATGFIFERKVKLF